MDSFQEMTDKILRSDPLDMAEKLTGDNYHNSEKTTKIGLALLQKKSKVLKERLTQGNDVYFGMSLNSYIKTFKEIGFRKIYEESFVVNEKDESFTCMYYCYWHDKYSVLLAFDTFKFSKESKEVLNSGNVYYNWKPNDMNDYPRIPYSGHWNKVEYGYINIGYFDCREAVNHYLNRMNESGSFISHWNEPSFLWLTNYNEHKNRQPNNLNFSDLFEVTRKRLACFPEDVRNIIGEYNKGK